MNQRLAFYISLSPFDFATLHYAMTDHAQLAQDEFDAGNYFRAIQFAQYALARDPDDASSFSTLGRASIRRGEVLVGIDALERSALLCPLSLQARVELAIGYGALNRRRLCRDLLMTIATVDDIETDLLLQIAAGLEAIEEPQLAMEACRQAGKHSPDSADVHYHMGHYAGVCGHPVSVSEALIRHAVDLDPHNLHYRIGLASLLIRVGRKCEAIAVLDRVIPKQLNEVTCQCCLKRIANLFFDSDDLPRAKVCAQRMAILQGKAASKSDIVIKQATRS